MHNLTTIKSHIPSGVLKNNRELNALVDVLQAVNKIKKAEIDRYERLFFLPAVTDRDGLERYLNEWGCEYTKQNTVRSLWLLANDKNYILSQKGTPAALIRWLRDQFTTDAVLPVVTINSFVKGKPMLLSDSVKANDWIPNDADIEAEMAAVQANNPVVPWVPTPLGGDWEPFKTSLNITVATGGNVPSLEFRNFIKSKVINYVAMVSNDFLNLTLNVT